MSESTKTTVKTSIYPSFGGKESVTGTPAPVVIARECQDACQSLKIVTNFNCVFLHGYRSVFMFLMSWWWCLTRASTAWTPAQTAAEPWGWGLGRSSNVCGRQENSPVHAESQADAFVYRSWTLKITPFLTRCSNRFVEDPSFEFQTPGELRMRCVVLSESGREGCVFGCG